MFVVLALGWNYSMMVRFGEQASGLWASEISSVLLSAHSSRPMYYYLGTIFVWAFPMSAFVPAAFAVAFSSKIPKEKRPLLFLFLWMVALVGAYSLWPMGKKKIEYLQPMLPAFALLCGWIWNELLNKEARGGFNAGDRILLGAHSLLVVVVGLVGIGFALVDGHGRWIVALLGAGLLVLGLAGLKLRSRPVAVLLWGTVLASLAGMIVNFVWFLPQMNSQVSPRIFAEEVSRQGGAASKVVIYAPGIAEQTQIQRKGQGIPALNFYMGYELGYVSSPSQLKVFLHKEPSGLVITLARSIENLELKDLGVKELYRQGISKARVELSAKRLPRRWQGPIGRLLEGLQEPEKYTVLLGRGK